MAAHTPVGEAEQVQVLGGFLTQEMIDPVDLRLAQDRVDDPVQGPERLRRRAERFSYTTRASLASPCWPSALVVSPNATGGIAR
jgi:hypothetical protein